MSKNARKENLSAFADKTIDPETGDMISSLVEIELAKQIKIEGTNWALAYEYTYRLDGVTYHVYQVLIVESAINGYVFTYTALESEYAEHIDEIKTILGKVDF